MSKFYVNPDGSYSCGDRLSPASVEVPERPSISHQWINGNWTFVQTVPQTVTRFQARAALHLNGILDQVEAIIADPSTDMLAKLLWENALDFQRDNATIAAIAQVLNLSNEDLDNLFIVAATIVS